MSRPDPERLEEGLRQLRELGYLSTPASAYVARRAAGGRSIFRAVLASSLWIGAGTGWAFALLLVASALLDDPGLLQWPRSVLILFIDLGLLLSVLFALLTGVFSTAVLLSHRGGSSISGSLAERAMVLVPGLLATIYLVDRVGRSLLEGASTGIWWTALPLLVLFAAFFAAVLSGAMRGALAMVRLQLHGVFKPPRVTAREQLLPAMIGAALSVLLLLTGPYRPGDRLPWFDEVEVRSTSAGVPLLVVAVDGLSGSVHLPGSGNAQAGVALPAEELEPTAYWNEIATGFDAQEHGLASPSTAAPRGWVVGGERLRDDPVLGTLITRLMPGVGLAAQQATDRRELRRPPVWEIVARSGSRARVINWWGSYPAARAQGLEVISDRQWLRHSAGAAADTLLATPDYLLFDDDGFASTLALYDGVLDSFYASLPDSTALPRRPELFRLAATADLYHLERAAEAAVGAGPEFVAVLLSGPDILARGGTALALRAAWERFLFDRVGRMVREGGRETWMLAVAREPDGAPSGSWGIGPWPAVAAESGARILTRLGIVPAADMAGVDDPAAPSTYGLLRSTSRTQPRLAPDLEQLRSLGYIGD